MLATAAAATIMRVELYPHQQEALKKMKNGSVLCGGVGSGKSRTALAYFMQQIGTRYWEDHVHVVLPKNLYIITTARKRDTLEWDKECCVFCLSRNAECSLAGIQVTIDSWNNIGKYAEIEDAFFIFDEQRVVGSGAWVKSFLKISRRNEWILLSATPGDTWIDYCPLFIANGFYKNKTDFCRQHVVYNRYSKFPKIDRYVETGRLIKLRKSILVDMPYPKEAKKHRINVLTEYDKDLEEMVENRWDPFENEPIKDISGYCYLSRKITNSDLSRLDAVKDILSKKKKIIVFYNFDYELLILRTLTSIEGVSVAEWNGHKHEPVPETDSWVYLVQYTAGAEGWNCITTDTTVFYSLNYSYKTMLQATGRIDRLNTPFKDLYYFVLSSNSKIDKAISRCLSNKKSFNESSFA